MSSKCGLVMGVLGLVIIAQAVGTLFFADQVKIAQEQTVEALAGWNGVIDTLEETNASLVSCNSLLKTL